MSKMCIVVNGSKTGPIRGRAESILHPEMIPSNVRALVFLLVAGSALSSCQPLFDRKVSGSVLSVKGVANGIIDGKTNRLKSGARIQPGEKILAFPDGRVDLMLLPGLLVQLDGRTEIELTELKFSKDGNELEHGMKSRDARMRLLQGTLLVSLGRAQTRTRLFVETKAGVFAAGSGRTFRMQINDEKIRVMCVRGKTIFEAANGGPRIQIGAGYFHEWPAFVAGPRSAAKAGAQAQAEVTEILVAEKHLRLLEREKRATLTPWQRL
jgi:hypothetical protein